MKKVFVLYGRKECYVVDCFSSANEAETMNCYGVYESFDSAIAEFKELVSEARDEFCEYEPISLDDDALEELKDADLFESYNCELDYEDDDETFIAWNCEIDEGESALWEMEFYPSDTTSNQILPKIYLKKVELKA